MYAEDIVAVQGQRMWARTPSLQAVFPKGVPRYSVADTEAMVDRLAPIRMPDGSQTRATSPEENAFIVATAFWCGLDFTYFAERFCWIDDGGHGLRRLYPLWESQQFLLRLLGQLERDRISSRSPDGLLLNVLKVRQVGITTLGVALIAHRLLTTAHVRGLVGSDIESQAAYLFRIAERVYRELPWFLKPARVTYNKDREIVWSSGSSLRTAWGKTTRGALQEVGGKKGNIERGRTYGTVHISELATWDNPDQLDTALLPGIPIARKTLVLFESTAELAEDWWHKHWQTSAKGIGRFRNLFIGCYAVPSKYSLPAPTAWVPKSTTTAWAEKAERESPEWCFGQAVHPTRDQLYWYETTRAFYESKGKLHEFLREMPSDPYECFMYAGTTVFTHDQLAGIDRCGTQRKIADIWTVEPAREVAALRRDPDPDAPPDPRPLPPLTPALRHPLAHQTNPVPPGFGFQRVPIATVRARTDSGLPPHERFDGFLVIWEHPRLRGPRRYVMGVDVADGLGQDYSVIDIIRLPTIDEPAEQVAQYVTNRLAAKDLAFVCDAIGRYYTDQDGVEALAAIETNNHGLATQDLLQLHLGYTHFYVWEYADAAQAERRFSTRIGWVTTSRTRPMLLSAFHAAVTTRDAITHQPDFILNSAVTRHELRHLVTESTLGEAEAARGQHDDAMMAAAIGYYVAYRMSGGEVEPIAERRRRKAAAAAMAAQSHRPPADWRNTAVTAEEADHGADADDEFTGDDRSRIDDFFFH